MANDLALERCPEHQSAYRKEDCWRVIYIHRHTSDGDNLEYARHVGYVRAVALVTGIPLADIYRESRELDELEARGLNPFAQEATP